MEREQIFRIKVITDEDVLKRFGNTMNDVLGTKQENIRTLNKEQEALRRVKEELKQVEKQESLSGKVQKERRQQLTAAELQHKQSIAEARMALNNYEKTSQSASGSMQNQALLLERLRMAWRKMSDEQRRSPQGQEMVRYIRQVNQALKEQDAQIGNYQRNVGNYQKNSINNTSFSQIYGQAMGAAASLYAVSRIFEAYKNFEYQIAKVKAISGATAEEFKALELDAKRLGTTTEYSAQQVADLQTNLARLGVSASDILKVTEAITQLATASGEDLARSADIAGVILKSFALESDQMLRVVNVMAQAFNKSALDLNTFAESIKYVAPLAQTAGVSLEQVSGMLAVLSDRGIRGSMAGTALRRILTEISTEGKTVSEALADLNKKGLTLASAMDEVGKYAMTALTVLVKNSKQVDEMTEAFYNSAGAAEYASEIMRDNLKGDIDRLRSAAEGASIWVGEKLSGALRVLVQWLTAAIDPLKVLLFTAGTYLVTLKSLNLINKARLSIMALMRLAYIKKAQALRDLNVSYVTYEGLLKRATVSGKAMIAVQLLMAGQFKAAATAAKLFFTSIGPIGWITVAVTALAGAFAIFSKGIDDTTKSAASLALQLSNEKQNLDELMNAVIQNEQGSKIRTAAIKQINEHYKEYLPNLLTDASSNMEIAQALSVVNEKLEENLRLKFYQEGKAKIQEKQFEVEKDALEGIMSAYDKLEGKTVQQKALAAASAAEAIKNLKETGDQLTFVKTIQALLWDDTTQSSIAVKTGWMGDLSTITRDIVDTTKEARNQLILLEAMAGNTSVVTDAISNLSIKALEERNKALSDQLESGKNSYGRGLSAIEINQLKKEQQLIEARIALKTKEADQDKKRGEEYGKRLQRLKDEKKLLEENLQKINADDKTSVAKQQGQIKAKQDEIDALTGASQKGLDKQNKDAAKAYKEREKLIDDNNKTIIDLINQNIDDEIALMADGYDKKLRLQAQADKKANDKLAFDKSKSLSDIDKQLPGADDTQKEALAKQRADIIVLYEDQATAIVQAGTAERFKIYSTMSDRELTALEVMLRAKMALQLDNNAELERIQEMQFISRSKALQKENDEALKSLKEYNDKVKQFEQKKTDTVDNIKVLESNYEVQKRIINATISDGNKRKNAHLQNEMELRKAKADTYLMQVRWMYEIGMVDEATVQAAIENAKKLQKELEDHASGKTSVDENGNKTETNFFKRMFDFKSMTDEEKQQLKQQAIDLAQEIGNSVIAIQTDISQRRLKNEQKRIDNERDIALKALEDKRRKGLISEKEYQRGMEAVNKEADAKREAAERAAFEREKKLRIAGVWMDVAAGIVKTLAQNVFPLTAFAIADIAMLTASGVAQTAVIASQKYEKGGIIPVGESKNGLSMGLLKGRSHAEGGMRLYIGGSDKPIAELEGDELLAVVNKNSVARYMPILSKLNQDGGGKKFAAGGVIRPFSVPRPANYRQMYAIPQQDVARELSNEIGSLKSEFKDYVDERINTLQVYVVESDITDTQDRVKKVQLKSKW